MVRPRREETAFIEVDVEIKPPLTWGQLCGEPDLIILINCSIKPAEVLLHIFVKSIQLVFHRTTPRVVRGFC